MKAYINKIRWRVVWLLSKFLNPSNSKWALGLLGLALLVGCGQVQAAVPVQMSSSGLPELSDQDTLRSGRLAPSFVQAGLVAVTDDFFLSYLETYEGGGQFIPGTYMGIAFGNMGRTQVAITFDYTTIVGIEQIAPEPHEERSVQFDHAFNTLSAQMLAEQRMNLDIISGATLSSHAIIYSFNDALRHALRETLIISREDRTIVGPHNFVPGIYSASSLGRNAEIDVIIRVNETTIYAVEIHHRETPEHAHANIEQIATNIITMQGDIDILSGATRSSVAIITALDYAMSLASAD